MFMTVYIEACFFIGELRCRWGSDPSREIWQTRCGSYVYSL